MEQIEPSSSFPLYHRVMSDTGTVATIGAASVLGLGGLAVIGAPLSWVAPLALLVVVGFPIVVGGYRGHLAQRELAREQQARAEAEVAFLQAVDEIRRLRQDVKTTHDIRAQLNTDLESTHGELTMVRSKADSLAAILQRVVPFEAETGLLNGDRFSKVLRREWARMQRQEASITLMVVALDAFDTFEATYGRIAYEAALRRISEVLRKAGSRPGDVAARLEHNRFVLLFPEAEQKYAPQLAEAVRKRLKQLGLANADAPDKFLTASFGIATMIPATGIAEATLMERAEAALHEAQFEGGDRCLRFRTLHRLKIERWNIAVEGSLTIDGMQHKLALAGYRGQSSHFQPGEAPRLCRATLDLATAVVEGELKITLDGESRVLHPGDCVYIPRGLATTAEVLSTHPVLCIEARRG